jgi:hypothetical protein
VSGTVEGRALFLGAPSAALHRAAATSDERETIEGMAATGRSLAVLVADGRLAGAIALRDMPRDDAKAGLAALEAPALNGDHRQAPLQHRGDVDPPGGQREGVQGEGVAQANLGAAPVLRIQGCIHRWPIRPC